MPYRYEEYYYDEENRSLYSASKNGKLFLEAYRYGSPFDSPLQDAKNDLIARRIADATEDSHSWRDVLEKSAKKCSDTGRTEGTFADAGNDFFHPVAVLDLPESEQKAVKSIRKLSFAEFVRKLSTRDFEDAVLKLDDTLLAQFEEACGQNVFEVPEMDDAECTEINRVFV